MRGTIAALLIAVALAVVLMVAGCSGAGVAAGDVRGDAVRTTAEDHLSAVLLFRSWTNVLHRRIPQPDGPEAGTSQGCAPELNFEFLEDGSMRMWGTNSDCSVFEYITAADQTTTGFIEWPNGMRMDGVWYPAEFDETFTNSSQRAVITFEDGMQLDYVYSTNIVTPLSPQIMDGVARRPDGQQMDFRLSRTQNLEDYLVIDLPDGAHMETHVPLQAVPGTLYWPVFEAGATGTYTSGTGRQLGFGLLGQDDRWETWEFEGGGNTTGAFTLSDGFGGAGQLMDGNDIVAALRWADPSAGTLDILAATTWQVTPSAAARDFQIDQWIANGAALNPMPMY